MQQDKHVAQCMHMLAAPGVVLRSLAPCTFGNVFPLHYSRLCSILLPRCLIWEWLELVGQGETRRLCKVDQRSRQQRHTQSSIQRQKKLCSSTQQPLLPNPNNPYQPRSTHLTDSAQICLLPPNFKQRSVLANLSCSSSY